MFIYTPPPRLWGFMCTWLVTNDVIVIFRGTQFVLSRDELLTLPEFVLLSLFPNGLFPDGQVNQFQEDGVYSVDVCTHFSNVSFCF